MNTISNPNEYKVVVFHNPTDFTFTPEMGCMFDGRPIFGITGAPGINGGETKTLPWAIGNQLAINLAKIVMMRDLGDDKPVLDAMGNPMVKAIWDTAKLERMRESYLIEMYTEDKPPALSETDRMMAKIEELEKLVKKDLNVQSEPKSDLSDTTMTPSQKAYLDKQDVIAELNKRGIKFDSRKNKADLEKLLA